MKTENHLTISFCDKQYFSKKRINLLSISCLIFIFSLLAGSTKAQGFGEISSPLCNTPLVGPGRTVDNINGGLVSLLSGGTVLNNLTDGDLNNYAQFNTAAMINPTSVISIKDTRNFYTAGLRTGFVIKAAGSVLDLTLFGSKFQIRTYRNNVLQETIISSSPSIKIEALLASDGKQRISFIASQAFDEIELYQTSTLALLSSLNVYYAFVEPATTCDYNCIVPITTTNYPSASVTKAVTGICACTVDSEGFIIDGNLTNHATMNQNLSIGGTQYVVVNAGTTIPAGQHVGFAISPNAGLLSLTLLGATTVSTYLGSTLQESHIASTLADVSLLDGSNNIQTLSFKTTKNFDRVRLTINAGLIGVATSINVYYAFTRSDSDNDGFPDCADKCPGSSDALDSDGDGTPDACDTPCSLNLGTDVTLCGQATSYDFSVLNPGSGLTWSILPTSPTGATVDQNGLVTGMTSLGTYYIVASQNASCADTVAITHREALIDPACNNPISGYGVDVFDPSGGFCLLCLSSSPGNPNNVINGNLNDYIEVTNFASILSNIPVIGVRDTLQTYPTGTRTGFVVRALGSILSASVLSNMEIRTYLNGTLQETVIGNSSLITVESFPSIGNKQRISFETSQPFNSVALYMKNGITLLTSLRVYYAFTAAADCLPFGGMGCLEYLLSGNGFHSNIALNHTGLSSAACVACSINNIGNVIDNDNSNFATISLAAAVGEVASISVSTPQTIGPNHQAGFAISNSAGLLNLSLLGEMRITTYLNGTQRESFVATNSLVDITLLEGNASGRARTSFLTSLSFNEIQFSVTSLASGLQNVNVYRAFIEKDSDGDGVPDCIDKCCLGPDHLDIDGDGIPDDCNINIAYNATCVACPVTVSLTGNGLSSNYVYSLSQGATQVGVFNNAGYTLTFLSAQSGIIPYTFNIGTSTPTLRAAKAVPLNIHPAVATWSAASTNPTVWEDSANWNAVTGNGSYPIWCTDVTIPENATDYPLLVAGDSCRDITFKNGASVGKIHFLNYRHAFVELTPKRNVWMMISAPLRYMYSADFHADRSWQDAISPKIFMRYFDVDYTVSSKPNPDGVTGTSNGHFSKAFAKLEEGLNPGSGFALWVNGAPYYNESSFPTGTSFQFPRRKSDGSDVQYSYHTSDGNWNGSPFYMPARGNDIRLELEWTNVSNPDRDNRYRFNFEHMMDGDSVLSVPLQGGRTAIVANPFLSHLDFNQFFEDNQSTIYNYYRIWDGTRFYSHIGAGSPAWTGLGGLTTSESEITANQYIAPIQAFFVESKPAGGTNIHFTPLASVADKNSKLRTTVEQSGILRLNLISGNKTGQAIVAVRPGATENYDANEDVFKLFSPLTDVPEIYTIANQTAIEINAINANIENHLIPIGIKTALTGSMQLQVSGIENLEASSKIYLIDKQEDKQYNLRTNNSISFEKDILENLEGRFYLSLRKNDYTGINDQPSGESGIEVLVHDRLITVSSSDKILRVSLYDLSGKVQYQHQATGHYIEQFNPMLPKGIFILKVETAHKTESHKIIF